MCGGFSCCPLSKAGKRLQQHDRRSEQGVDTAKLCNFFRADATLLENVLDLVRLDSEHGLFTSLCSAMTDYEFLLVATFWLQDCQVRGISARSRVFPYLRLALWPAGSLQCTRLTRASLARVALSKGCWSQ